MKHDPIPSGDPQAAQWVEALRSDGFCIIPNAIERAQVEALANDLAPTFESMPRSVGPFYGDGTVRFGGLLTRSQHAADFVLNPPVRAVVRAMLGPWCDVDQLNLTQAIEIAPGSPAQPPHRDQDMWGGTKGIAEYLVNVMWPFTPYTKENGATVIWPGSHEQQEQILLPEEDAIYAEAEPGSAIVFLGSTLHSGGANRTDLPRRGMIISYSLGWLKPYELQTLIYPPAVAATFPTELARLIGYQIHRPNLGNVHGGCPSVLLETAECTAQPATDYLKPEHEMLIEMWRDGLLEVGA